MSTKPTFLLLLFLTAQLLICHTTSAALHERLFLMGFKDAWMLTLFEFTFYSIVTCTKRMVSTKRKLLDGFQRDHLLCAVTMAISHTLTNEGFVRLNFTTATLFRSSKVIFVMLGSYAILGAKVSLRETLAGLVLSIGLALFALADKMSSPKFDLIGCGCCFLSLCGASLLANVQQRVLKKSSHNEDAQTDLLFFQYSGGALMMLPLCLIFGDIHAIGIDIHSSSSLSQFIPTFLGFVSCLYIGLGPLLKITKLFDATTTQVVTAMRRVCTFGLSFFLFPKSFTTLHAAGIVLSVSAAVALHMSKHQKTKET